jgi:hypothetical protein
MMMCRVWQSHLSKPAAETTYLILFVRMLLIYYSKTRQTLMLHRSDGVFSNYGS